MRHLLTSHGPKKRQAPSKGVILYMITSMIDQISVQKLVRTNIVCIDIAYRCIQHVYFYKNTNICWKSFRRWFHISIFNRVPTSTQSGSVFHSYVSLPKGMIPHAATQHFPIPTAVSPDTLQHMTDGCCTTLGTFFGLCRLGEGVL